MILEMESKLGMLCIVLDLVVKFNAMALDWATKSMQME